jgi:hypothetical protein
VAWKQGKNDRTFSVVQYVTDPRQGEIDPELGAGLDGGVGAGIGAILGVPGGPE